MKRQKYPKYVYILSALILCLGFASLSFGSDVKLSFTSDYKEDPVGFNSNSDSDTIIKAPGSTCCVNNGWKTESVADGMYLVNGAVTGAAVTDMNPTGLKAILATSIDVTEGETYTVEATGKSVQYSYAAQNSNPIYSLLLGLKQSDGSMLWWESNHFTAVENSYTTLTSVFQAAVSSQFYMLLVDMNQVFETNDGILGLKVHGPDPQQPPVPEPATWLLLSGGAAYLLQRRLRRGQRPCTTAPF